MIGTHAFNWKKGPITMYQITTILSQKLHKETIFRVQDLTLETDPMTLNVLL